MEQRKRFFAARLGLDEEDEKQNDTAASPPSAPGTASTSASTSTSSFTPSSLAPVCDQDMVQGQETSSLVERGIPAAYNPDSQNHPYTCTSVAVHGQGGSSKLENGEGGRSVPAAYSTEDVKYEMGHTDALALVDGATPDCCMMVEGKQGSEDVSVEYRWTAAASAEGMLSQGNGRNGTPYENPYTFTPPDTTTPLNTCASSNTFTLPHTSLRPESFIPSSTFTAPNGAMCQLDQIGVETPHTGQQRHTRGAQHPGSEEHTEAQTMALHPYQRWDEDLEQAVVLHQHHRRDEDPGKTVALHQHHRLDEDLEHALALDQCLGQWDEDPETRQHESSSAQVRHNLCESSAVLLFDCPLSCVDVLPNVLRGCKAEQQHSLGEHQTLDHTIPEYTIPGHTIPDHIIPGQTIPDHTILGHTILRHTIPDHTIPNHTVPSHTIPEDTIAAHTSPDLTIPNHTIPDHTIPDHRIPDGSIPEHEAGGRQEAVGKQEHCQKMVPEEVRGAVGKQERPQKMIPEEVRGAVGSGWFSLGEFLWSKGVTLGVERFIPNEPTRTAPSTPAPAIPEVMGIRHQRTEAAPSTPVRGMPGTTGIRPQGREAAPSTPFVDSAQAQGIWPPHPEGALSSFVCDTPQTGGTWPRQADPIRTMSVDTIHTVSASPSHAVQAESSQITAHSDRSASVNPILMLHPHPTQLPQSHPTQLLQPHSSHMLHTHPSHMRLPHPSPSLPLDPTRTVPSHLAYLESPTPDPFSQPQPHLPNSPFGLQREGRQTSDTKWDSTHLFLPHSLSQSRNLSGVPQEHPLTLTQRLAAAVGQLHSGGESDNPGGQLVNPGGQMAHAGGSASRNANQVSLRGPPPHPLLHRPNAMPSDTQPGPSLPAGAYPHGTPRDITLVGEAQSGRMTAGKPLNGEVHSRNILAGAGHFGGIPAGASLGSTEYSSSMPASKLAQWSEGYLQSALGRSASGAPLHSASSRIPSLLPPYMPTPRRSHKRHVVTGDAVEEELQREEGIQSRGIKEEWVSGCIVPKSRRGMGISSHSMGNHIPRHTTGVMSPQAMNGYTRGLNIPEALNGYTTGVRIPQGVNGYSRGVRSEEAKSGAVLKGIPSFGSFGAPSEASSKGPQPSIHLLQGSRSLVQEDPEEATRKLLIQAAKALEQKKMNQFHGLCLGLKSTAKRRGFAIERTTYALLQALILKSEGRAFAFLKTPSKIKVQTLEEAMVWHYTGTPFCPFAGIATLGMIIPRLLGRPHVHIVCVGEALVPQLPSILKLLARHPAGSVSEAAPGKKVLRSFRVTYVRSGPLARPSRPEYETAKSQGRTALALQGLAQTLGVKFKFHGIELTDSSVDLLYQIEKGPEVAMAFCLTYDLMTFSDDVSVGGGTRQKLLQCVRKLEPDVFTSLENDVEASGPEFLPRFCNAMELLCTVFQAHDALVHPQEAKKLHTFEQFYWNFIACSVVGCDGSERRVRPTSVAHRRQLFQAMGLVTCPISTQIVDAEYEMLLSYPDGFGLCLQDDHLFLMWRGTKIIAASSWAFPSFSNGNVLYPL